MKAYLKSILITLGVVLAIYLVFSMAALLQSVRIAKQASGEVNALLADLRNSRPDAALARLPQIQNQLVSAQSWQRYSFWIAVVPVARTDYLFYQKLLDSGVRISTSAQTLVTRLAKPGLTPSLQTLDFSQLGNAYLSVNQDIAAALRDLQQAATEADHVHVDLLPVNDQAQVASLITSAKQLSELAQAFSPVIAGLPTLLGVNGTQNYLILLENPNELRPTGGFIGTYGRLTMDQGSVKTFFTDDIYNVDAKLLGHEKDLAPDPIQRYANVKYWYVRDGNWSPDFPTAAAQVARLYQEATGEPIDHVIALTPRMVQDFMRITGSITVDNVTFTSENLVDALQYQVEQQFWHVGLTDQQRKKIINDMAQVLRQRFFAMNSDQTHAFATAMQQALDEKDILAYSTNPELQRQIVAAGWAGQVRSTDRDYLYIVDANIGALKTDRLVDRQFNYHIQALPDGRWQGTLQLTYKNRGFFDYRTTRYRTYTRVYVPLGSSLQQATGLMDNDKMPPNAKAAVYTELGKTVFAGFVSVEPGQERTVTFTYVLPAAVQTAINGDHHYQLLMQKEPGTKPVVTGSIDALTDLYSFAPSNIAYHLDGKKSLTFTQTPTRDQQYLLTLQKP